jgi:ACS family hexuronate transporter-like MFS transporter
MGICGVCVVPIVFAANTTNLWFAVALISLAAAAHQGWSANVYTLVSDTFPKQAVGSVIGFGGMLGAVGGMLIAKLTAYILEVTGTYVVVFLIAGSTYLVCLAIVHLINPRHEPAQLAP